MSDTIPLGDIPVPVEDPDPAPEIVEGGHATVLITPESAPESGGEISSVDLDQEGRIAALEVRVESLETGLAETAVVAGTAAILAADAETGVAETPEIAEEIASDVVEDSTIEKNDETGELEIDAPDDVSPRSHGPSRLFATRQQLREMRNNR